jgi:hypothetical protein
MKSVALAILLASQISFASTNLFICQHSDSSSEFNLGVYNINGTVTAEMDWGNGSTTMPATVTSLSRRSAKQNPYVVEVAEHLKINWSQVEFVNVYEAGENSYSDDGSGAVGVSFLAPRGVVLSQGMLFGWAGAVTCD